MESCVRGYHVYKDIWGAAVGEELDCTRERGNPRDAYAVAVVRNGRTVGHLPRKLCRLCALFYKKRRIYQLQRFWKTKVLF